MLSYWERLLAHRHWVTINLFDKKFRLCARCLGVVLGFCFLKIMHLSLLAPTTVIPAQIGFYISIFMALPAILDWITQNFGLRQSHNNIRLTTGFFEGFGIGLLSLTNLSAIQRIFAVLVIGLSVLTIGILGRKFNQKLSQTF